MFWLFGLEACGILVSQPGIFACIGRQSLNASTTREVPTEEWFLGGVLSGTNSISIFLGHRAW